MGLLSWTHLIQKSHTDWQFVNKTMEVTLSCHQSSLNSKLNSRPLRKPNSRIWWASSVVRSGRLAYRRCCSCSDVTSETGGRDQPGAEELSNVGSRTWSHQAFMWLPQVHWASARGVMLWCCRLDLPADIPLSHLGAADVRSACLRGRQRVWTQARLIIMDALLPASSQPTDSIHLLTLCRLRCHSGTGSTWTSWSGWRELFSVPYLWQLTGNDWLFRSLCSVVLPCRAPYSATDIVSLCVFRTAVN